jgi:catechol 2,3-dioxygenase-like lactoylglutathione lyase family enzyme
MDDSLETAVNAEGGRRHSNASIDMKLEVIVIPVTDVDRAKEFYTRLGWRLDADRVDRNFRLIQFTPPGSGSSVQFGENLTPAAPGSAQGLILAVSDIEGTRQQLVARGIGVSDIYHCASGTGCRFPGIGVRIGGPHPEHLSYGRLFRSAIRTAIAGCCRKSQRGFPGVLQARRSMRRCMTFPRR